jgi:stage V sporulation protein B
VADKKQGFVKGAVILAAAGVICRLLGVVFRIPLSNIVGNYGIGLYQLVFPLYSLLLIISSAGVPVALSKIVARERDNPAECKKILFNAVISLGVIGIIVSALFAVFARQIAALQGESDIWVLYTAIAPSVFFVWFISAFRGYFQGLSNMVPTAVSQIVEQIFKVGVGLTLAVLLVKKSVLWAVFGAVLAVSVSEFVAVILLFIIYLRVRKPKPAAKTKKARLDFGVIKRIFVTSAPITLMSIVFPLVLMFDSFFIVPALQHSGIKNATELYGVSSGAVHTLINLPTVVGMAIAAALVPMVARYFKQGQTAEMKSKAKSAVWTVFAFAVFCALVYFIFAPLILKILYAGAFRGRPEEFDIGVRLLRIESAAIILICLTQVITSILQGVDKSRWPLLGLLAGGAGKILFEIFLIKKIGIAAVSISNVLCFGVALSVNIIIVAKSVFAKNNLSTENK